MQKLLKKLFIILLSFSLSHAQAGVIMQGFYWDPPYDPQLSWWDRLARESTSLSEAEFTAIWIPPVLKGAAGGYSMGYDPFDDYDIGSKDQRGTYPTRWGTREQLQRSTAVMRANGLDIYLDTILSHRQGDQGDKKFFYKNAYNQMGEGRFQKSSWDFRPYDTPFGRYLDQSTTYVREQLVMAGEWVTKALNVQGYRFDYAKASSPEFVKDYMNAPAMSGKFAVAEHWSSLYEIQDFIHRSNGKVAAFDFPLWETLRELANADGYFDMRRLQGAGLVARDPGHAVTFVENHDTEQSFKSFNKILGYAFILTSAGYPSVFWKDYYIYGLKQPLDNLVWIHEKLAEGETVYRWADDDFLAYERLGGAGLLVGLNDNKNSERAEWVQTQFGSRVQLHDYTGHGPDLQTDDNGKVRLPVGANSYVAYSRLGHGEKFQLKSYRTTQEFAGSKDLDIAPAANGDFKSIGRVFIQKSTTMNIDLYFKPDGWTTNSKMLIRVLDPGGKQILTKSANAQNNSLHAEAKASTTGFYDLQIKSEDVPSGQTNFWWVHSYQAPKAF